MATAPVILAIVDGSDQSTNTVAYVGRTLSSKNVAIELFHVLAEAPEPLFDLGENRETAAFETQILKWKSSRSYQIDRFMKTAEEILLCHIVRPLSEPHPVRESYFNSRNEANWMDESSRRIIPAMVEAKERLSRAGFNPQSFHTAIIKEKKSRADGIMGEAEALKAGTIILGRRGTTGVEEFTMGRVTRKILYLAYDRTIWIV